MLELKVGRLLEIHEHFVIDRGLFERAERELRSKGLKVAEFEARSLQLLRERVVELVPIAADASLELTAESAERFATVLKTMGDVPTDPSARAHVPIEVCGTLYRHLMDILSRLRDECRKRLYYQVDSMAAQLLADHAVHFGPDVEKSFPAANYDVEEAGRCLALNRWTAVVLHLMRALEPALAALEADLETAVPKEQWHNKIDQIEVSIELLKERKHPTKVATKEEIKWYSDAATHFRYIKDAWRNHAAHGKDRYDEERARRIYDNVRSFMVSLAERLSEPGLRSSGRG